MECNCIEFYLSVEEMKGVIVRNAYDFSQVGMLKFNSALVDGGYRHHASLCGWGLISTKMCHK